MAKFITSRYSPISGATKFCAATCQAQRYVHMWVFDWQLCFLESAYLGKTLKKYQVYFLAFSLFK